VFDSFLKNLSSSDPIPESTYNLVEELFILSQETFSSKSQRDDAIQTALSPLIGQPDVVVHGEGDEVDEIITGPNNTCCVLVEIKDEIGTAESDPSVQGALSYSKYWGQPLVRIDSVPRILA
jgi:hypothetical protein